MGSGGVDGRAWVGVGFEEAVEGGAADAEHFGGAHFVAVGASEDTSDVTEDGAVEVGVLGEGIEGNGHGGDGDGPVEERDVDGANPLTGALEGGSGDDGFEFADVAGPGIGSEAREDAGGKTAERLIVLPAPVAEKESGEEGDIFFAVAQRGNGEADGGEVTGEVGAEGIGGGEAAQGLGGAGDELKGDGGFGGADALVGGTLDEVAELALLVGRELVDAGEIEEAGAGFCPEGLRVFDECGGDAGDEGAGGGRTEEMEGLGDEEFAGAVLAFDTDEAEMGGGAAHAVEEVLHDEAAASHGTEHPALGLNPVGLEELEVEGVRGLRLEFLIVVEDRGKVHGCFPAVWNIGRGRPGIRGRPGTRD